MIKKSASRNQRSKGVKVKHVLQILLMLCICFWLLYQIKCSYDRHREMIDKGSKTPMKDDDDDSGGSLKLGRKDLHEKQGEDEYDESKDEDEGNEGEEGQVDDEQIRLDVERMEEEERLEARKREVDVEEVGNHEEHEGIEEEEGHDKIDEVEDERGEDDAEINEGDVEGGAEIEREEDFLDEDKGGREERDEEDNDRGDKEEPFVEDDDIAEDKDPDAVSENTNEAREAHSQADDASDAVFHDTHIDDDNTDDDDPNDAGVDRLTKPKTISLSEKAHKATAVRKAQENSNSSEGDEQASYISGVGGVEITGSRANVTESDTVLLLPLAQRLAAPNNGSNDVSFEQTTGLKTGNASTAEETQNISTIPDGDGDRTESTPDTSTQEAMKPLDLLNIQMVGESDDVSKLEKNQEGDDGSKTLPSIEDQANVIRMQLLNEHDSGESRKR